MDVTAHHLFDAFNDSMWHTYAIPWPDKQYVENKYWQSVYLPLARKCVSEKWDHDHYIARTMAKLFSSNYRYITPKDLYNDNVLKSYAEEIKVGRPKVEPKADWVRHEGILLSTICKGESELRILKSAMSPFPAWFRVAYPENMDADSEIAGWWGSQFLYEINDNAELAAFVEDIRPGRIALLVAIKNDHGFINGEVT